MIEVKSWGKLIWTKDVTWKWNYKFIFNSKCQLCKKRFEIFLIIKSAQHLASLLKITHLFFLRPLLWNNNKSLLNNSFLKNLLWEHYWIYSKFQKVLFLKQFLLLSKTVSTWLLILNLCLIRSSCKANEK